MGLMCVSLENNRIVISKDNSQESYQCGRITLIRDRIDIQKQRYEMISKEMTLQSLHIVEMISHN